MSMRSPFLRVLLKMFLKMWTHANKLRTFFLCKLVQCEHRLRYGILKISILFCRYGGLFSTALLFRCFLYL